MQANQVSVWLKAFVPVDIVLDFNNTTKKDFLRGCIVFDALTIPSNLNIDLTTAYILFIHKITSSINILEKQVSYWILNEYSITKQ